MTLLIIYLCVAIGVSFVCSILEAVLLSITPAYVEGLDKTKASDTQAVIQVRDKLDQSISGILILNTFAHTIGAAGVGAQASTVFGSQWDTVVAIVLTLAILYLSEIIPKTIGATFWRQLAVPASKIIRLITKAVYPLIWVSTFITQVFRSGKEHKVTREEIIALASLGHKMGTLISQENEYVANVLQLRKMTTKQILTPRRVVHFLQMDMTVQQSLELEQTAHFSRIPVFGENRDIIVGLVTRIELLMADREGKGESLVGQLVSPITRVSEQKPVHELLDLFIETRAHLFLVEDQYQQTVGIVTLEDAIETMLGREIIDETDQVEDMQIFAKQMPKI